MTSITNTSRRGFLRGTAMTAGGIFMPNIILSQEGGAKKLNFAAIGVGGKGSSDVANAAKVANIVAICDVDRKTLKDAKGKYADAETFEDFREMFDKMGDKIDGVTISTPDHAHYPAAMEAIKRGKHVCVQKPLVNRIWEANQLHQAAKKKGVHTNMGNQGHTGEGIRVLKEWIAAGAIGKVKEIHVWTNRPIWPIGRPGSPPRRMSLISRVCTRSPGAATANTARAPWATWAATSSTALSGAASWASLTNWKPSARN